MSETAAVILAAGKSTRMKSDLPKVLHEICGAPMLAYAMDACVEASAGRLVIVVGHRKDLVIDAFSGRNDITWVEQAEQKGTGHAVLCCEEVLAGFTGRVLVVAGDMPLLRARTLRALIDQAEATGDAVTLATSILDDPAGYGRIVRDGQGRLWAIVEDHDCTQEQSAIREVNPSYYNFDARCLFDALHQVAPDGAKGEYYITGAIERLRSEGKGVGVIPAVPAEEAMGINSRADLAVVSAVMQKRIQREWMENGVTIVDPDSTWINAGAQIGPDTVLLPFSYVDRGARIGAACRIGPFASVMCGDQVAAGESIGPCSAVGAVRS